MTDRETIDRARMLFVGDTQGDRLARQWKLNGDSYSTIAARLGVGVTTVYKAIKGITWATI